MGDGVLVYFGYPQAHEDDAERAVRAALSVVDVVARALSRRRRVGRRLGYVDPMTSLSYRGHRFPAPIIQHAIWLYLRFTLSYRDVEELLAERGLDLSYETIRRWVLKFGPLLARGLRQRRPRPGDR